MGFTTHDCIRKQADRQAKFFVSYDKVSLAHCRLPTRQSCVAFGERSLPPRRLAIHDVVNVLSETFLANPRG
jgi:hypothetical protein